MIFKIQEGSTVMMMFDAVSHREALNRYPHSDLPQGHVIRDELGYVLNEGSIKELEAWHNIDWMRQKVT